MLTTSLLQSAAKNYTYGTHRFCDPAETYRAISPHFKTMGITRIADVTGLDVIGIPVCMAVRPNSKSLSVSQGKGLNLMLARVSAAMESIEAYHAENITQPIVTASYREMAQQAVACDPAELNLHPLSVYREDLPVPWIKGFDLMTETETWVPYDLVHTRFLHDPFRLPVFHVSSNGLASGNHVLEAISHAICEVIERDATALWDLRPTSPDLDDTFLDPGTVDSPACRDLLEKIDRAGFVTCISYQTSDVGIPSFGCLITERPPVSPLLSASIFAGYGCHLSKEIALIRAITEAVQSRLTFISGARDDAFRYHFSTARSAFHQEFWETNLSRIKPAVDFRKLTSLETGSLKGDVAAQLSLLKKAGFEQAVAVDLTLPDIGIAVVRAVIPRMEFSNEGRFINRLGQRARNQLAEEFLFQEVLKRTPK